MSLGVDDILPFLLERGFVIPADIVRGDLRLVDASRRNRNLRVLRRHAPSFLLKQPDPGEPRASETLGIEARFYQLGMEDPRLAAVRPLLPRRIDFVADRSLLVLELLRGAEPLGRPVTPEVAARLGDAVGVVHRTFRDPGLRADPRIASLPVRPPGVLRLHQPFPEMLAHLSGGQRRALKIAQEAEAIGACLDGLRREWRIETLVHGDLKAANVLVAEEDRAPRVYLVDWELAALGDPAWDVGSVFCALLLTSIDEPEDAPPLAPICRAAWDAYRRAAGLDGPEAAAVLSRAVRASAARLFQTAFEHAAHADALPGRAALMLQAAANIATDPSAASFHVLGIPPTWILADVLRA